MEGSCSTGQSPQRAVVPMEEEEEEEQQQQQQQQQQELNTDHYSGEFEKIRLLAHKLQRCQLQQNKGTYEVRLHCEKSSIFLHDTSFI
jgi:hypothetical protein